MREGAMVTTTLLLERLHDSQDAEAWRLFDERFRGVLIATGLRLGLTRTDAEDAAQETMLQALREYQAGKYDRARGRLSSWIVGIARHRIIDARRQGARRAGHLAALSEVAAMNDVREADVADAFDHALERHIFEEAWRVLKEETKGDSASLEAFELTSLRGVAIASAARMTGLSVDQVYLARNRVSKRLRAAVERVDRAIRDGV
ncbi:MAG: hypothetical protein KDA16_00535 [Phycisphaerales bacterium]|nr:hypothetical protein [Phycisphaerales bacterium]